MTLKDITINDLKTNLRWYKAALKNALLQEDNEEAKDLKITIKNYENEIKARGAQ